MDIGAVSEAAATNRMLRRPDASVIVALATGARAGRVACGVARATALVVREVVDELHAMQLSVDLDDCVVVVIRHNGSDYRG